MDTQEIWSSWLKAISFIAFLSHFTCNVIVNKQSMAGEKYIENFCGIKKEKLCRVLIKYHMALINMTHSIFLF